MQLISMLMVILSFLMLVGAFFFIARWRRARAYSPVVVIREGVAHIGISAILEYPETDKPLMALLEEEYPRCEAVVIVDLLRCDASIRILSQRFRLVRVNHSHLADVRGLYRSRNRAFRRVVLVDLPYEYRNYALDVAKRVSAFEYMIYMCGDSIVERDAIGYAAALIASHPLTADVEATSLLGAPIRIMRSDTASLSPIRLNIPQPLAWRRKRGGIVAAVSLLMPMAVVVLAVKSDAPILFVAAVAISFAIGAIIYLSCCVVTENSLFSRLDTILRNFYRFLVDKVKKNDYLYKECKSDGRMWWNPLFRRVETKRNNRESL
jgi:hypothetical protein